MLIGHQLTKDGFWSSFGIVDPKLPTDWPATINPWRISRMLIKSFIVCDSFVEIVVNSFESAFSCSFTRTCFRQRFQQSFRGISLADKGTGASSERLCFILG